MKIHIIVWGVLLGILVGTNVWACMMAYDPQPVVYDYHSQRINQNEATAVAVLRQISTAAETYATTHYGSYPTTEYQLSYYINPYSFSRNYCGAVYEGYGFQCSFGSTGYVVTAAPNDFGRTGNKIFQIYTGGVLSER